MTLQMPSIPSGKPSIFAGAKVHQTRQALAAEIRETIEILLKSTYVPGYTDTLRKYLAAVEPGRVRDPARLPVSSTGPNSKAATKIGCVYARLSFLIQLFWDQVLDKTDNAAQIRGHLADLRAWATCGIDKCRLAGNPQDGYWLEVSSAKPR
jgi:hypothetical protein